LLICKFKKTPEALTAPNPTNAQNTSLSVSRDTSADIGGSVQNSAEDNREDSTSSRSKFCSDKLLNDVEKVGQEVSGRDDRILAGERVGVGFDVRAEIA